MSSRDSFLKDYRPKSEITVAWVSALCRDRGPGALWPSKLSDDLLIQFSRAVRIALLSARSVEAIDCGNATQAIAIAFHAVLSLAQTHPSGKFTEEFEISDAQLYQLVQIFSFGLEREAMRRITGITFEEDEVALREALFAAITCPR
jgi:hypothetical protein